MDISFIIPVYNGESCIKKCIDKLKKWDQREEKGIEIEIIIVDDGSTDSTLQILNEEASKDSRIRVFHIENSGQGIARNHGLDAAGGEYIYFVDADDWVDTEGVYKLYKKAEEIQADVTMGGYYRVGGEETIQVHLPGNGYIRRLGSAEEVRRYHEVKTESAFGYVWNKLYRRKFLTGHQLYMDDIRKLNMEDFLFNLKVWSKAPSFYCMDTPVYYYVADNASTTRRPDPDVHIKNTAMINELIRYLKKGNVLEENLDMVIPLIARSFCWSLIKNIPYEGRKMEDLKRRSRAFTEASEIHTAVKIPGVFKHLGRLPSLPQRLFFSLCLWMIRMRMTAPICLLFYICYPVMQKYASSVLK